MKKQILIPLLVGLAFAILTIRANAQTSDVSGTSQPVETGTVTGTLVNHSQGGSIPESLSIMMHILDQDYNQLGMLHTQSQANGRFQFENVPLNEEFLYVGIVGYQGATYSSQPVPYHGLNKPDIELPIYESTNDLSKAQVDEMHVLFNFAEDGLEVNEIYLLSNLGDRTITGTLTLADGRPATIVFPLPVRADYIFFKPDATDRFVKLDNSFADTAPLVPGERTGNMMVSYLLPYTDTMSYSYTAPVAIKNIDYLLPAEQNVQLDGLNISGPEVTTLQDKSVYQVYKYNDLHMGQTVKVNFIGKPNIQPSIASPIVTKPGVLTKDLIIEIGSGLIGLTLIGVGVWQWRKSTREETDIGEEMDEIRLHQVATEIAQLDDAHDHGAIEEEIYHQQRADLLEQAKSILKQLDE